MIRIFTVNLFVFAALLVIVELFLGTWLRYDPYTVAGVTCPDAQVHHNYCPGIVHRRYMARADGGAVVDTFVNQSAIAVPKPDTRESTTDFADYDIINIGDSFLQAEEVSFARRLTAQMPVGDLQALQVGYSSWAPITMLNWFREHVSKPGSHVNLLLMTNDFIASYGNSNLGYYEHLKSSDAAYFEFNTTKAKSADDSLLASLTRRSFFLSRWAQFRKVAKAEKSKQALVNAKPSFDSTAFAAFDASCEPLPAYADRREHLPTLLYDYLAFARPSKCWSSVQREAVDNAINDIERIRTLLQARKVSLSIYLIPAGWAFPEENMVGKASPRFYGIQAQATITHAGLGNHLASRLRNLDFVDLEPVIRQLKEEDSEHWYFPVDGHWTAHAQRRLATWLAERWDRSKRME
ncbi:MAG: alginate O-acetyltransferase AlgX-related protein [Pseudomonadales bacterium]